ncbi:sulfite oxidase heme-binding subunit YedZ [Rhodoferax sp. PAMC 29310]|uniref:sulfite oxidase heme-binding subunit YedZ n=1 Tax=Rhodoferax sp. PAMC 29310 TaxID=2822760 RepID=UPI001B319006|nr:protein-methionine-sulfoxide reductase heme-binding subunit MsrQ [Rhodoferax sp. PAMC 29310]
MATLPKKGLLHPAAKPLVFLLCLMPLCWLVYAAIANQLGANPAEALIRSTGDWTLRFLCLVLTVTPLRIIAKVPALARYRRMLGLFVYFYGFLHLLSYGWLEMSLDPSAIVKDIIKRPFILVGFASMLLLTALAATSFNRAIRALGGKRWQQLHRLVYIVAALALLHFFWMRSGKNDYAEVIVYAVILGALLGWRLIRILMIKGHSPSIGSAYSYKNNSK